MKADGNGKEAFVRKILYRSGKKKGQFRGVEFRFESAAQALGSRGGVARAANLSKKRISEIGRMGSTARWQMKDVNGTGLTDGQLRERIRKYVLKHPDSCASSLMPSRTQSGVETNRLNLVLPHSRVRYMAMKRRLQKTLDELARRGDIPAVDFHRLERQHHDAFMAKINKLMAKQSSKKA